MLQTLALLIGLLSIDSPALAQQPRVTGIKAEYRHGQTFVTWKDAAEGEAGAKFRYSLYRSDKPIAQENLASAELCYHGVLNNSAKEFGYAFKMADRLDPTKPTAIIVEGGKPLPMWSGLAVRTAKRDGESYYAVIATDEAYAPLSKIVPGESATTTAVAEKVAPIQPIKLYDWSERKGAYVKQTSVLSEKGLPLTVNLHASQGTGGPAGEYGDYYLYFATAEMGWRDGLPGVFSVQGTRSNLGNRLILQSRDAIEQPGGARAQETYWFGYYCVPFGAKHTEPRAYPFTERRMLWVIDWVCAKYDVDRQRISCQGGSMGATGSVRFGLMNPWLFSIVYPNRPRTQLRRLPRLDKEEDLPEEPLMDDGKTPYYQRMDMARFAATAEGEIPFCVWCTGRRDTSAPWDGQIALAKAMKEAKRGYAFAWNNGDHSSGTAAMGLVEKYYPMQKFARNKSYPAMTNSSIDDDIGNGDPTNGTPVGGINLGFQWDEAVVDEPAKWSVSIGNLLAKADMTVDITPRRCQQFKAKPGEKFNYTTSTGGKGEVVADAKGLVTVEKVVIKPGMKTTVTIEK